MVPVRSSGPGVVYVTGVTTGPPAVIQSMWPHAFTAGQQIGCWNIPGALNLNGHLKVKAVVDATHFSVTNLAGTDITASGPWQHGGPWQVVSVTVSGTGTGYTDGDAVIFTGGVSGSITARATINVTAGSITSVTMLDGGFYVTPPIPPTPPTVTVTSGGSGQTLTAVMSHPVTEGSIQWCGVETNQAMSVGLRGWFDGDNGTFTRSMAMGTWNGLASLTVDSSHIAHVTAPSGYGAASPKISIWGSGNSTLNNGGTPYTITVDTATTFHFTVNSSIPAATYTGANNTCGPASNADCLRISQRAFTGDPIWDQVVSMTATYGPQRHKFDGGTIGQFDVINTNADVQIIYGIKYFVDQGDAVAKASVLYWLTHLRRMYTSAGWGVFESGSSMGGNYTWSQFSNYILRNFGTLYTIGKGLLTTQERQDFRDQILNGWDATDLQSVTKNIPLEDTGTATFNGTQWIGTGTHWLTDIHPCDSYGCDTVYLLWRSISNPSGEYYVTSVVDDTHITVNTLNTTPVGTPTHLTILHHWVPGVAGFMWARGFWSGAVNQEMYWPNKQALNVDKCCFITHQNGSESYGSIMSIAGALADEDSRALDLFSMYQSLTWDAIMTDTLGAYTGFGSAGTSYNADSDLPYRKDALWFMLQSVPSLWTSFPTEWSKQNTMYKIYATTPELYNGQPQFAVWGVGGGASWISNNLYPYQGRADASFLFAPQSTEAQQLRAFFSAISLPNTNSNYVGNAILADSPNTPTGTLTGLSHQRLFTPTNKAEMVSLTGTVIPVTMSMDAVISTGCFTFPSDCTHMMLLALSAKGADYYGTTPAAGDLHVFKRQPLLEPDDASQVPGQLDQADTRAKTSMIDFVGVGLHASLGYGDWAISNITRWHGPDNAGDPANNIVYTTAETKKQYNAQIDRAQISVAQFKKPSTEENIIVYVDIDQTSAATKTPFRHQIHYSQNGQAAAPTHVDAEGDTTCPGSGGCANLDTNRTVLSQQSGSLGNVYGIVTKILAPTGGTIFVKDDGSSFPGGLGSTHRVSIYGGASSSATPNSGDWIEVHKIAQNMSDTTLTATAINPDANWTGVQTTNNVALFARGGVLRSSLTNFTTTHSGTAQYLIAGLKPGSYAVTVGGTPVSGSPFSVTSSRDAAINFESTAGVVALSGTPTTLAVTTSSLSAGQVGVPKTATLAATGGTSPYTWKIISGLPCEGLFLNATTGVYSGTPTRAQTCDPTFSVTDSAGITVDSATLPATMSAGAPALTLTASPSSLSFSCTAGGSNPSAQNIAVAATGGTLDQFSGSKTQSWDSISPTSGSAAGNIAVSITGCPSLGAGTVTDTVTISSTTGGITGSPQTVGITLVVSPSGGGGGGAHPSPAGGKVGANGKVIIH